MQQGIHVVERARAAALAAVGLEAPEPAVGLLDLGRLIEGHLPEPPAGRPLTVVGLGPLLEAAGDEAAGVLRRLRRSLHDGQPWFDWRRIPLVLLVEGRLVEGAGGAGPSLRTDRGEWPLAPLLGRDLRPASSQPGWWWAPQPG